MVELVEVEDESFETKQVGPSDNEDDYFTDTDSEISSDDDDTTIPDETLADRLRALKDIIPPTTRSFVSSTVNTTTSYIQTGLAFSGKALFVLSTSALFLGVPWALAFADEQQLVEMEKEMRMREMGGEILSSGTTAGSPNAQLGNQQGKPAL